MLSGRDHLKIVEPKPDRITLFNFFHKPKYKILSIFGDEDYLVLNSSNFKIDKKLIIIIKGADYDILFKYSVFIKWYIFYLRLTFN